MSKSGTEKSSRAFRTISEAGEELGLQSHVLRFWESKFSEFQPLKRSGGRRLYRPEDIEFLQGIKILLHQEKHPIKDVQKLIRKKGAKRIMELGRTARPAARPLDVRKANLVPQRISAAPKQQTDAPKPDASPAIDIPAINIKEPEKAAPRPSPVAAPPSVNTPAHEDSRGENVVPLAARRKAADQKALQEAIVRLRSLRTRWQSFMTD